MGNLLPRIHGLHFAEFVLCGNPLTIYGSHDILDLYTRIPGRSIIIFEGKYFINFQTCGWHDSNALDTMIFIILRHNGYVKSLIVPLDFERYTCSRVTQGNNGKKVFKVQVFTSINLNNLVASLNPCLPRRPARHDLAYIGCNKRHPDLKGNNESDKGQDGI